jgi:hypothetical protein
MANAHTNGAQQGDEPIAEVEMRPWPPGNYPEPGTAVIVFHGVGQQVPFDTLDLVARGLQQTQIERGGAKSASKIRVGYMRLPQRNGEPVVLPHATIALDDSRRVDIFEVYWAPHTEGKVKALDVLLFLFTAGCRGIVNAVGPRWQRWVFGRLRTFKTGKHTIPAFLFAFLVVLALFVINVVSATVAAAGIFTPGSASWLTSNLLADLTVDLWLFVVGGLAFGAGALFLSSILRGLSVRRSTEAEKVMPSWRLPPVWRAISWALVWGGLLLVIGSAVLVLLHLGFAYAGAPESSWARWTNRAVNLEIPFWFILGTWGFVVGLSMLARKVFVQYVGDVAAYVSAYSVNEYWELRARIKEEGVKVAHAVYGALTADGQAAYPRVVVVAHSLGSIIAYDSLNQLLREERLEPSGATRLDVVRRTPAFITFGSPLDKTAFVFTAQRGSEAEVREAAAAATQPLIVDYANRPERWINIWSRRDWISGSLQYYDDSDDPKSSPHGARFVENCEDDWAATPISAHNEYWANPLFRTKLYEVVR